MVIHHANAVAQDCSAGNRAGGVNGKDRNAPTGSPDVTEKLRHERAFPGSGRPGHTDDVSPSGQWKEGVKRVQPLRVFVFHQRGQAWQRPSVRSLKAKEHILGGYHNGDGRGALSRM
jgi:hypothetical protein